MNCPFSGLDSFDLGLMVSGDWNEHLDFKSLEAMEPKILELPAKYPALQRLERTTPTSGIFRGASVLYVVE